MKVVLDTSVIVAAVCSDAGASRRLSVAALERRLQVLVSVPLMIEDEAVLNRPEHLLAAGNDGPDVAVVLDAFASVARPVRLAFLWRPLLRDGDDDMVVETAMNGQGEAIVTFNLRDFAPAAERFRIVILTPG